MNVANFRLGKPINEPDRDDRAEASEDGKEEDFCDVVDHGIVFPDTNMIWEWSWKASQALKKLTVLQRSFVEWYTTGCGAAEAYRRASGRRNLGATARRNADILKNRKEVGEAIELCLRDKSVPSRIDRAVRIKALEASMMRCQEKRDEKGVIRAVELLSRLHGDLVERTEVTVMTDGQAAALKRFNAALEQAKSLAQPAAITDNEPQTVVVQAEPETNGELT